MDNWFEHDDRLRALAMRVAALEDNVAFLEEWCEEQQDVLDQSAGPVAYDYEIESEPDPAPRALLRVVDLRDEALAGEAAGAEPDEDECKGESDDDDVECDDSESPTIVAAVETEHDRKVRHIRARLDWLRLRLSASQVAWSGAPAVSG